MERRAFLKAATALAGVSLAPAWLISTEQPGQLAIVLIQQNGNEATYRGYHRVAAPRNTATWTVDGTLATNKITIAFPMCSGVAQKITGFGICIGGKLMAVCDLTGMSLLVVSGVIPQFAPGDLQIQAGV